MTYSEYNVDGYLNWIHTLSQRRFIHETLEMILEHQQFIHIPYLTITENYDGPFLFPLASCYDEKHESLRLAGYEVPDDSSSTVLTPNYNLKQNNDLPFSKKSILLGEDQVHEYWEQCRGTAGELANNYFLNVNIIEPERVIWYMKTGEIPKSEKESANSILEFFKDHLFTDIQDRDRY